MTGKTNAVTEMNLEKPQVSRTTRSGPALPEIKRRRIDDKVILPIKPNVRSYSAEHPWVKVPPQDQYLQGVVR